MSIKKLTIKGLRGFSEETIINFSIPDKQNPGSGLTVLVGPNNSGKSTVIEAIHLLATNVKVIPKTSRNEINKGKIMIEAIDEVGNTISISSTKNGGSFVEKRFNNEIQENYWYNKLNTFILSSKRNFSSTFNSDNYQTRESYKGNVGNSEYRTENNINNNFGSRLLNIYNNKNLFEECLEQVLKPVPKWTIESLNENTSYLEFSFEDTKHSSNGAGDGYINIFNIVDSLYDSSENNVILIDEPEISLHPDLQKKLFKLLVESSKDKQIIISTHSPYFTDWELFANQSKIIRFRKENEKIKIYELSQLSKDGINKIINDVNNIHTLSLDANNIYFLQDNIILTEGQDDVICYPKIFEQYGYIPNASYFGWGAGGADNINIILKMLRDLGYQKVFTIVDKDKCESVKELAKEYIGYDFYAIEAGDVHNKKRNKNIDKIIEKINCSSLEEPEKEDIILFINRKFEDKKGLISSRKNYQINKEYEKDIIKLINSMKSYFAVTLDNSEKESNSNTFTNNYDFDNKKKAQNLLNIWLEKNKLYKNIQNKYKKFEFHSGDGGILSFKKIKDNIYYVVIEESASISANHTITLNYHFIIDIVKNKVKLKKKQVVSNSLPVNKIIRLIEKIFN